VCRGGGGKKGQQERIKDEGDRKRLRRKEGRNEVAAKRCPPLNFFPSFLLLERRELRRKEGRNEAAAERRPPLTFFLPSTSPLSLPSLPSYTSVTPSSLPLHLSLAFVSLPSLHSFTAFLPLGPFATGDPHWK
jgi:hypothetical protein